MQALAFVDLETTGATAAIDRITEIGIVEVDADGTVRHWQQLVNPQTRIPPFIENLTGISNAMVASAPVFASIADEVRQRLHGRLFIAHNARFDYGFLKSEFRRLGSEFRASVLCTVKLSRALYPEYTRHSLDALIERHRLHADARHRALADAQLIHQFWAKIHVDRSSSEIATAIATQNPPRNLPPQLPPELADDLPETPGVYCLHGSDDQVLWIARASNIARHIFRQFAKPPRSSREREVHERVRRISWLETAGEIGARLQESRLRRLTPPTHQRAHRNIATPQPRWPFNGPAVLRESTVLHLIDQWRYLGSAANPDEIPQLLTTPRPDFDAEIYGILSKHAGQMGGLEMRISAIAGHIDGGD